MAYRCGSAQSTGGLSKADPSRVGTAAGWILIAAMSLGGSAGATGGGIKLRRVLFLGRVVVYRLRGRTLGGKLRAHLHAVPLLLGAYLLVLAIGTGSIAAIAEIDLGRAGFEMASALGNCDTRYNPRRV